jgi:hypothetical protein
MSHTITGLDQTEEEILNYEVSDAALETAGATGEKITGMPTTPAALICIPFSAESRHRRGVAQYPLFEE